MSVVRLTDEYLLKKITRSEYSSGECHAALEIHFLNYTGEDIIAVQADGAVHPIVSPKKDTVNGDVLFVRFMVATPEKLSGRVLLHGKLLEEPCVQFTEIQVRKSDLLNGPIFLKEVDLVVALPRFRDVLQHPAQKRLQGDYLNALQLKMSESWDDVPIRIFANDPLGDISTMYLVINGVLSSFPVTNNEDEPAICSVNFRSPTTTSGRVEMLLDTSKIFVDGCSEVKTKEYPEPWFIGPDKSVVQKAHRASIRRRQATIDFDNLEKENASLKKEIRDKESKTKLVIDELVAKHSKVLENMEETHKRRIRDIEDQLYTQKTRVSQLETDLETSKVLNARMVEIQKSQTAREMVLINKRNQQLKLAVAVLSLAGAIIALVAKIVAKK